MFTFKLYDDCDVFGLSRDNVNGDLKREFHYSVHCEGLEELDNKVFVWVSENIIQFFRESDEVSGAKRGRVIAAISLTNPKDTGFDLLYFAEHIKKNSLISKNNEEVTLQYLRRAEEIFEDFPFFKDKKCIHCKKRYKNPDRVFMRLCLLEFLLAVDTHDEIFAVYPGFDELRKKLRESKVYLLLCAKLRYCMYHYKGREALNSEESTFVTSKYADLLMDSEYNKMVPPEYFDEPRFLYNPEYELMKIMKGKDSAILEMRVKQKITNFFLTKHAVVESSIGRVRPYWLAIAFRLLHFVLMAMIILWSLWSLLHPEGNSGLVKCFYDDWWWKIAVVVCLVIEGIFAIIQSKSPVFHPRILVALMIGWFTIAVSEDLIKSQLDLGEGMVLVSLVVVLIIVGMMLRGEVRQHSPYYRIQWPWKAYNYRKTTFVLIYAMFWNLFLGIIMQQVTYSSLLKTSGAVPEVVLGQLPDDVSVYKKSVETCISMLDDYDRSMEGIIHDNGRANFNSEVTVKSLDTMLSFNAYLRTGKADAKSAMEIHDAYLEQIEQWLQMVENNMGVIMSYHHDTCWVPKITKSDTVWMGFYKERAREDCHVIKQLDDVHYVPIDTTHNPSWIKLSRFVDNCKLATMGYDTKAGIERNLDSVREIKNDLRILLLDIDKFLINISNPDTLMNWSNYSDVGSLKFETDDYYLAYLGYEARTKHSYTRDLTLLPKHLSFDDNKLKLFKKVDGYFTVFPRMLVFHSLIVLLIAFVGQLIISDKSVTEPL